MKRLIFLLLACFIISISQGQNEVSEVDAANLYNQSIQLMKTDISAAIEALDSCLKICNLVGDSAIEIRFKAEQFLCDLQLRNTTNLFYTEKKINEAKLAAFKTISIAEKYQSEEVQDKSKKLLGQIYSVIGANYFKEKAYNKAIMAFDSALLFNSSLYKSLLNKALAYRALNNVDDFGKSIDEFITEANKYNDTVQIANAKKTAMEYYRSSGSKANAGNKLADALKYLNKALEYGEDKDVYYFLSDVYNKQKKYDNAIEAANKGLNLETGDSTAKAKYYYSLGVAYLGKGNKNEACAAFKNAAFGQFAQAAKAQMTNNQCGK